MKTIVWFDDREATDVGVVGGKYRGLAALTRAGVQVPRAFAVTTGAYREAMAATGLNEQVRALIADIDPDRPETGTGLSSQIATLLAEHALPAGLAQEIAAAYATLCEGEDAVAVAVRSSATAEDLATASFAGQQDTYLNVLGADAVAASIKACWNSLHSPRALLYRAQRPELALGDLAMAVVVQILVPARVAGVMFSANPQTGDRTEVVIEGSWGLGEAVVGGLVTPDRFVVDKQTGRTTAARVAQKTIRVARGATGTVDEPVPAAYQGLPCLTAKDRRELAELARRVEASFGAPQDIEWAIDEGGERFLLQARPVTTSLSNAYPVTEETE